jgi:hypothetical protein
MESLDVVASLVILSHRVPPRRTIIAKANLAGTLGNDRPYVTGDRHERAAS